MNAGALAKLTFVFQDDGNLLSDTGTESDKGGGGSPLKTTLKCLIKQDSCLAENIILEKAVRKTGFTK